MSYGIIVTGNDTGGNFIVTDSNKDLINYQVTLSGAASSLTSAQINGGQVFINGNYSGAQGHPIAATFVSGGAIEFKKITFSGTPSQNNHLSNVAATAQVVNYIIIKKMSEISNSGGNYGIQIKESGGDVAFDSRRITTNDSFYMSETKAIRSVSGINGLITSTGTSYVDTDALFSLVMTGMVESSVSAATWNGSSGNVNFLGFFASDEDNTTSYLSNSNTLVMGYLR